MSGNETIVVGGGLAGLAAACTLAARGHAVTLLEANEWVGGKAAELREQGFRFDMGPTILTVPRVLERIFAEAGRPVSDYLDLRRLDPQWRCFFEGGEVLDLEEDVGAMARRIEAFTGRATDAAGYRRFIAVAERLSQLSDRIFFWHALDGIRDTFKGSETFNPATLKDVMELRMGRSVAGVVRSHVPEPRVAQMLDHFTQYVGSSPYGSPAVLCGIAHMQVGEGVWYPMGGTRAVPVALERLARALGVTIETGCPVARIDTEDGRVTGVTTADGRFLPAAAVISNMDSVRTLKELVGGEPAKAFLKRRRYEPACSGVVLYLGLDRAYDHLLHHNFVFSRDPKEEFDAIYARGEPAPDPTCYLAATAGTDPDSAPPGGEALYILVHTPYLRPGQDWTALFPGYRQVILDKLKRCAGMADIEERIVYEEALTPQDIHDRYRVLDGAIYGLASHGRLTGAFKPSNRSRDVAGLYLAGGAAHPGPGMPMVLMSGWIAADARDQDAPADAASAGAAPGGRSRPAQAEPPDHSPALQRMFGKWLHGYFARHFDGVRVALDGLPRLPPDQPVVLCSNHPSWWDPITLMLLARAYFPERAGFGPIDGEALKRYPMLRWLGLFGVERDSAASLRGFLRAGDAILSRPDTVLGMTVQGTFTDPRTRPVTVEPGVAHLLRRHPRVPMVPVAIEYPFWNERAPEVLVRFGAPDWGPDDRAHASAEALTGWVAGGLERNLDALAALAQTREPERFETVVEGRKGVGGLYDRLRRLGAWVTGRRFDPAHDRRERRSAHEGR